MFNCQMPSHLPEFLEQGAVLIRATLTHYNPNITFSFLFFFFLSLEICYTRVIRLDLTTDGFASGLCQVARFSLVVYVSASLLQVRLTVLYQ